MFLTKTCRPISSYHAESLFRGNFYFNILGWWSGDSGAPGATQPQRDQPLLGLILSWFTAASYSKKKNKPNKKQSKPPSSGRWPVLVILHHNGSWQSSCGSLLLRVFHQREQFSWDVKLGCSSLLHSGISHREGQHRRGIFGKGSNLIPVEIICCHVTFCLPLVFMYF